jgi:YgiT-type zinc finger domain-containing protein
MINKEDYCEFCDGIAKPTLVTRTFERHGQKFEYKYIPALVCNKCGEAYLDGETVIKIEREIAEEVFATA